MRIIALATGAGVPAGDFAGRVAELHARAALLKLSDGPCITLLAGELGRQPRGISLDLPEGISLRQFVSAIAECAKRGGIVRFAGSSLRVDLRSARPWRSGINALHFDGRSPATARAYRTARSALERDGRAQGFRGMAGARLESLSAAIKTRDIAAGERAAADLIGLGEGKTPAGDDYLVGVYAALWSCSSARAFAETLAPKLIALTARTSDLSALYLREAASGEVSERLADVAAGICAGGSDDVVANAVAKALSVGHSSGAAGIFGLLKGYADCAETPFQANADSVLAPAF
ncbi:MAG TPA: DUF2877 domain-containing protein [Xanthobacteraceae bacterium]